MGLSMGMSVAALLLGLLLGAGLTRVWQRRRAGAMLATHQQQVDDALARERERIHADLHDDLGAKLLELVYGAAEPAQADLARSALQDLRDVVSRTRGTAGTLLEVLGDMQAEAHQRLRAVGISLDWQQPDDLPDRPLAPERALHLFRIHREAISNVIRHAQAQALQVVVHAHAAGLHLEITDDGSGMALANGGSPGRGTRNMRARAEELAGRITWRGATAGGTRVILSFPYHPPA